MIEHHLSGMKARKRNVGVCLRDLQGAAEFWVWGARERSDGVFDALPEVRVRAREWDSLEARGKELSEFAKTVGGAARP